MKWVFNFVTWAGPLAALAAWLLYRSLSAAYFHVSSYATLDTKACGGIDSCGFLGIIIACVFVFGAFRLWMEFIWQVNAWLEQEGH